METYYVLTVDCDTEEIARSIQRYINANYNSEEVYWNAISKKKE